MLSRARRWRKIIAALAVLGSALPATAAPRISDELDELQDELSIAQPLASNLAAARRNLELARLRQTRYVKLQFPLAIRRLESRIKLARAELAAHKRRIEELEPYGKTLPQHPFALTLDAEGLAIAELEISIEDLELERDLRLRHDKLERRILQLEIESAQELVDQLRRGR